MADRPLIIKSKEFALQIIKVCNILDKCIEVKKLLIASINTAKSKVVK